MPIDEQADNSEKQSMSQPTKTASENLQKYQLNPKGQEIHNAHDKVAMAAGNKKLSSMGLDMHLTDHTGTTRGLKDVQEQPAAKELLDHAKDQMGGATSPEFIEFKTNMMKLEQRQKDGKISKDELNETCKQVDRLLTSKEGKAPEHVRHILAKEIMLHAANPLDIAQGNNETCQSVALGKMIFAHHPSKAAELIATTAIEGAWLSPDHRTKISASASDLDTDGSEEIPYPPNDGDRTAATRILDAVLNGDMLTRAGKDAKPAYHWITDEYKTVTGDTTTILANTSLFADPDTNVTKPEDLANLLKKMKDGHQLPVMISVDGNWPTYNGGNEDPSTSRHMVLVTDYDDTKTPPTVQVSNSWDKRWTARSGTQTLDQLYQTTTRCH